jgi:hypothetical protein
VLTIEFHTSRNPNNCLGYPHDRLSVVKHQQLACQVGDFGGFVSKSSTNLDSMIFSTGSIFIFGSWICEVDDKGNLYERLLEDQENQEDLTLSVRSTKEVAESLSRLAMSESI